MAVRGGGGHLQTKIWEHQEMWSLHTLKVRLNVSTKSVL